MQKMYYNMDEKFPSNYKKGGSVKTTGSKGVKASSKKLIDEKVPVGKSPAAMPAGKVMEKAMGGPIGDSADKAMPEGKIMEKKSGGKMDKRVGKC